MVSVLISKPKLLTLFKTPTLIGVVLLLLSACDNEGDTEGFGQTFLLNQLGITEIQIRARDTRPASGEIYLATNDTEQLLAIGITPTGEEDITADVTWSSADPTIASIDSNGLVTTGANANSVTITATLSTLDGFAPVNVSTAAATALAFYSKDANGDDVIIPTTDFNVDVCRNTQVEVYGVFSDSTRRLTQKVDWSVTNGAATQIRVSNELGSKGVVGTSLVATGLQIGAAIVGGSVSATLGIVPTTSNAPITAISISPASGDLVLNETLQMSASADFGAGAEDISANVSWGSSAPGIATVDTSGVVTAVADGSSNISAMCHTVTSNTSTVNVQGATELQYIEINRSSFPNGYVSLSISQTRQLDLNVVYNNSVDTSLGTDIDTDWSVRLLPGQGTPISVDNSDSGSKGTVTGLAAGIAEVVVVRSGKSDSIVVVVQ